MRLKEVMYDYRHLKMLRDLGYIVAVHNDYRQDGAFRTFWLFTHPDGHWVKGEGNSDMEALERAHGCHLDRERRT